MKKKVILSSVIILCLLCQITVFAWFGRFTAPVAANVTLANPTATVLVEKYNPTDSSYTALPISNNIFTHTIDQYRIYRWQNTVCSSFTSEAYYRITVTSDFKAPNLDTPPNVYISAALSISASDSALSTFRIAKSQCVAKNAVQASFPASGFTDITGEFTFPDVSLKTVGTDKYYTSVLYLKIVPDDISIRNGMALITNMTSQYTVTNKLTFSFGFKSTPYHTEP